MSVKNSQSTFSTPKEEERSDHSLVAILLAVYNGEKHLGALLKSLVEQDYPHIGIHVRDNCSSDTTRDILQMWQNRFPQKIFLHYSDKNEGVVKNFGALTEITDASYFMYCDGDDVWYPWKVSRTLQKMKDLERSHGVATPLLVHTDLAVVDENLDMIAPSFWKFSRLNTHEKCQELPRLLVQNHVTGCTVMINRALRNLAAPIPVDCVMHDWWLALVAAAFGKVERLPLATLNYRQHSSNDTGAKSYGLRGYLQQRAKRTSLIQEKKIAQVNQFIGRYQQQLSAEKCYLVEAYLRMQKACMPHRIFLMLKHGFLKSGILRNLILNH